MFSTIRKALAGAVAALLASLGVALSDGDLTGAEALVALGAACVAGGIVFAAPANEVVPDLASDFDMEG